MRVFLADLGHNQLTFSSDIYPIGAANIAAYTTAYLKSPTPVEVRLFREPEELRAALDSSAPDVLALSSYAWNHELSKSLARYGKRRKHDLITMMGGPNYPLTLEEMASFLEGMPEIDVAVRGPTYEGERAFLNVMQRLIDVGGSLSGLLEESVPGNDWFDRSKGTFVRGQLIPRMDDLDEIPSPYLTGWMDPYCSSGYFPMLQIARGCPFTCQFCNSSVKENTKIHAHSVENVKRDLLHIAERVRPELPVCFADDNFGMYERDQEVAEYIAFLQDKFAWPRYIRTTTGKNRADRVIKVMRTVRGTLPMTSAVQSLNPVVLENIKRSNISLDAYAEIQKEVQAQGMQAYGELILSMPGETKASFLKAVSDLLDSGVKRVSAHQLMLLHGAPLSNPDQRKRFGFQTRWRVVARNLGNYGTGEDVVEVEEMVVETPTFTFDEYFETRVFHLLLTIFYHEGNYEEAFEYARHHGIKPFDLVMHLQRSLASAPAGFRKVIEQFVTESREELFESSDECIKWARAHFPGLLDGSIGGNLLSKYSMLGRFFVGEEALDFLAASIRTLLAERGLEASSPGVESVISYLRAIMLQTPFAESLGAAPSWTAEFDVEGWRESGYKEPLEAHRFGRPLEFHTRVDDGKRSVILSRIATFGEHPTGLGKFTRTMFSRDFRRTLVRSGDKAGNGHAA
jgi:radical SAM superfamily enzyme YgiQ (UPF0313 family)